MNFNLTSIIGNMDEGSITTQRRRRLCSIVAPQLKVECTQEGKRTVVVENWKPESRSEIPRVVVSHPAEGNQTAAIDQRTKSFCGQARDDFESSQSSNELVMNRLRKHCSLPRRMNITRQDESADAVYVPCNSSSHIDVVSSGFLPVCAIQRAPLVSNNIDSKHPRIAKPELAINLSTCHSKNTARNDCLSVRKTQRSMSAHSVALPGPDSSVLRDPVTGKMYKRGKLLGKGGFARVYEGVELSTSKKYGLKIIDKSRLTRRPQREKVNDEIELHAAACLVGHPNIVGFDANFENARVICLVLELCERRSLAQYLRRKEFMSESQVSDLTWQIVCGLAHIHQCGLLHRDLKLGNILLSDDMTVKIGDFGLATRASWGRRKTICGTPNFIAPEVLQRLGHGPEADIWAVGCILYTLIVGKPPFETGSLKDTYKCILKNSYRIPTTVSHEAADLIRWMLRSKPHARPSLKDVTQHVFFLKHETNLRFPGIEQLEIDFPSKEISPDRVLPLRRKSVLPRLTVHDEMSSSTGTLSSGQARHNSCPSDPCSVYCTIPQARNDASSSTGPKITKHDHLKLVVTLTQTANPSTDGSEIDEEKHNLSMATTMPASSNDNNILCLQNNLSNGNQANNNRTDCRDCETTEQATEEYNDQRINHNNNTLNLKCRYYVHTPTKKSVAKVKTSPVKLLASKLQKFRIPSPKNCMKAASNSLKSKVDECDKACPIIPTTHAVLDTSATTWITKWVDYSNRYGFGYQLADGGICVLFNNASHIALLPDGKTVEYTEADWDSSQMKTFSLHSPPSDLLRPVKILQQFTTYMDRNLKQTSSAHKNEMNVPKSSVRMLTWSRTSDHISMYLNNGTLQVNFCHDHTKVNVSNIHRRTGMAITYVNEKKQTYRYVGSELSKDIGKVSLNNRMIHVHNEFHHLLGNNDCSSHPFCCTIRNGTDIDQKLQCHETMIAVA